MLTLPLLLLLATPAPPAATSASRVLVLDFRNDGAREDLVRTVRDTLVVHLAQQPSLTVLSSDDLRRVADLEAQKQAVGCDEQSCLAELAGAVGAELVVFGNVAQLGALTQINISVLDVVHASVRGRRSVEVATLDAVPAQVRAAADALFGLQQQPAPADGPPLLLVGGIGVGVGVVVGVVGAVMLASDQAIITGLNGKGGDAQAKLDAVDRYGFLDPLVLGTGVIIAVVGAGVAVSGLVLE